MSLDNFVTPILPCKIKGFSNRIFIKREDLIPYYFGGNKVRIAQTYYDDIDAQGKNCMVGYGNARSNLNRALAMMGISRGIPCYIISPSDEDGTRQKTFNSHMVEECNALFRYCTKQNVPETVDSVFEEIKANGLLPYYVYGNHYGQGNEAVPVRAYAKVYHEIRKQEKELGIKFDYIFLPTGTGMTHSGLLAGQREARGNETIIGVSIARTIKQERQKIQEYVEAYEGKKIDGLKITLLDNYIAGGYGKYNDAIRTTIYEMLKKGIPLDPTYTGKAFWGMCDYIKKQEVQEKNILFLHTGGTPLFYDFLALENLEGNKT